MREQPALAAASAVFGHRDLVLRNASIHRSLSEHGAQVDRRGIGGRWLLQCLEHFASYFVAVPADRWAQMQVNTSRVRADTLLHDLQTPFEHA